MIKVGIITVSDSCSAGKRKDESGKLLKEKAERLGWQVIEYQVVADDAEKIVRALKRLADKERVDLIFTTGGTGLSPRDVTPEATKKVLDKEVPGIAEMMRVCGYQKEPRAILSRGTAGIRKKSLVINLPGSPKAVEESLELLLPVIPHGLKVLKGEVTSHEDAG